MNHTNLLRKTQKTMSTEIGRMREKIAENGEVKGGREIRDLASVLPVQVNELGSPLLWPKSDASNLVCQWAMDNLIS